MSTVLIPATLHVKKAELIEGVVYLPSPVISTRPGVSFQSRWRPHK